MSTIVFLDSNIGGLSSVAIQLAKLAGFKTVFLAKHPEEYQKSDQNPANFANITITVDTYDIQAVLDAITDMPLSGVVAFDDYRLVVAAAASYSMSLPSPTVPGLLNCRYKDRMRKCTTNSNSSREFSILEEIVHSSPIGYPCVLKPVDDSGSVGVVACRNDHDFLTHLTTLLSRNENTRAYKMRPRVLVERFIVGPEYSAELIWNKEHAEWQLIGFTEKTVDCAPYFVESGHDFPAVISANDYADWEAEIIRWLNAVGLTNTVAHVEFRVENNAPVLIEINPRPPGDRIDELVLITKGIDLIGTYLSYWVKGGFSQARSFPSAPFASIRYLLSTNDRSENRPSISDNFSPGTLIKSDGPLFSQSQHPVQDSYSRTGYAMATGTTADIAKRSAALFCDQLLDIYD